jgi:hypothetical protein
MGGLSQMKLTSFEKNSHFETIPKIIYVSILYIVCVLMEHRVVFFLAGSPHSHTMENLDVSY